MTEWGLFFAIKNEEATPDAERVVVHGRDERRNDDDDDDEDDEASEGDAADRDPSDPFDV